MRKYCVGFWSQVYPRLESAEWISGRCMKEYGQKDEDGLPYHFYDNCQGRQNYGPEQDHA
jgi:hypothetical protein